MAKQTKSQKDTVERVMDEFKEGKLRMGGSGPKVKHPKQAIAIALHEAGASNKESPKANRKNLAKSKAKERKGETAAPCRSSTPREHLGKGKAAGHDRTKAELYAEAKRRHLSGRSSMSKAQLERALAP